MSYVVCIIILTMSLINSFVILSSAKSESSSSMPKENPRKQRREERQQMHESVDGYIGDLGSKIEKVTIATDLTELKKTIDDLAFMLDAEQQQAEQFRAQRETRGRNRARRSEKERNFQRTLRDKLRANNKEQLKVIKELHDALQRIQSLHVTAETQKGKDDALRLWNNAKNKLDQELNAFFITHQNLQQIREKEQQDRSEREKASEMVEQASKAQETEELEQELKKLRETQQAREAFAELKHVAATVPKSFGPSKF